MDIQSQIDDLCRRATDSYGGFLPAGKCGEIANTMQLMLAVCGAATMVHRMDDVKHGECPVCDALAALEKSSE
jgi:hypothetical protein